MDSCGAPAEMRRRSEEKLRGGELFDRQGHEPFLVAVNGVAPAEGYVAVGESHQPAVGNGNAVGVGTEIAQRVFWPAESALA